MAIRTDELGGTDWVDGNILTGGDLNDTVDAIIDIAAKGQAQVPYGILKASGSWTNEGSLAADRFTVVGGVNGTVQVADSNVVFVGNHFVNGYTRDVSLDTTHNPNSFSSIENAFDLNYTTFAGKGGSIGSYNESFGKTFSSTYIHSVAYKIETSQGTNQGGHSMNLQTFNGSSWTTIGVLYSSSSAGSFIREGKFIINDTIQGIRINFTKGGSTTSSNRRVYYLNYGLVDVESELILDTNILTLTGDENTLTLYSDGLTSPSIVSTGNGDTQINNIITGQAIGNSSTDNINIKPKTDILIKKFLCPIDFLGQDSIINFSLNLAGKTLTNISSNTITTLPTNTNISLTSSGTVSSGPNSASPVNRARGICFIPKKNLLLKSVTKQSGLASNNLLVKELYSTDINQGVDISDSASYVQASTATTVNLTTNIYLMKDKSYFVGFSNNVNTDSVGVTDWVEDSNIKPIQLSGVRNVISMTFDELNDDGERETGNIDVSLMKGFDYVINITDDAGSRSNISGLRNFNRFMLESNNYSLISHFNTETSDDLDLLTSINAKISDGILETNEFKLNQGKSTIIPLLDNMSGDLKVTFVLRTTDMDVTPELYGYGVYLQ